MAKQLSELKKRALLAKQRMKMGYWEKVLTEKEKLMAEVGATYEGRKLASDVQREKYKREVNIKVSEYGSKDEELYVKVCKMLDAEEFIINPIAMLIDKDEYEKMDGEEKQRYVLKLSNKYIELKERYYKERMSKIS